VPPSAPLPAGTPAVPLPPGNTAVLPPLPPLVECTKETFLEPKDVLRCAEVADRADRIASTPGREVVRGRGDAGGEGAMLTGTRAGTDVTPG
jgi:hypothetical protein